MKAFELVQLGNVYYILNQAGVIVRGPIRDSMSAKRLLTSYIKAPGFKKFDPFMESEHDEERVYHELIPSDEFDAGLDWQGK